MKNLNILFFPLFLLTVFSFSHCKKNKNDPQLPPETTSGAMTFGCKINGRIFLPQDGNGKPGLYVQYVNLGNVTDGGWHLNIPAYNYNAKEGISIETDSLLLIEGKSYEFKNLKGNSSAFYLVSNNSTGGVDVYSKLDNENGKLFISKFDQTNRILSGTFYFTGTKNSNGEKVTVTEGRFDVKY